MKSNITKCRILLNYILIFTLFTAIHFEVFCQEEQGKHQFIMYITAPTMTSVSENISEEYGIGDQAWTMEVGVHTRLFHLVAISGAIGYGGIKDYLPFSQGTTWGTLESSFSTLSYDFKAGLWTPALAMKKEKELNLSAGAGQY